MTDKLSDEQSQRLLAAIDAKLDHAYGGDKDTEIASWRAKQIEYYLGLNTNPAPEGRSQVVDRSVYETLSAMHPSLVRIFAGSSDEVCKFVPTGPEDEAGAELTTAYVNYVVGQKNPWEQIVSDWIHDSSLLANGYAMAYWEENDKESEEEEYEGQTDDQLAMLAQDQEIEIVGVESYDDPMYVAKPVTVPDPMTGMPTQVIPPPQQLHDVSIKKRAGYGCVKICVLPPEHCIIDSDTPDWTLQQCEYFEYRQEKTIAALREMGLDVDEDVSDDIDLRSGSEDQARNRFSEQQTQEGTTTGVMRKVVCRMVWIKTSLDDKEARYYYAIIVGRTVLYCESCARIPVASMCPIPLPHRHVGMSIAETVSDQQDIKTAIKRGGLDNLYLANNGRHVISDKVNLEDFLDSRPGGVIRMVDGSLPAQGHVLPLVHPFQFGQIVESLEYFDQERQNRAGVSRYFSGTDAGAINRTASGISQLTNAAAQRVEHLARMMAPAVEYLFSIVHELILKHRNKADMVKLKGQWVPIDPRAWQTKRDVRISVGVGAGNKDSLLGALNMQFQQQVMMAQSPMQVVKPENIYQTLIEMAKLNGFANPAKFWTDPTQEPPQPQGPPPQLQVEMAKLQHDAQKTQLQVQAQQQQQQEQMALEKYKSDQDTQAKVFIAQLQSQTQQVLEAMKQQMGQMQMQLEGARMQMDGQMNQHAQRMDLMGKELEYLNQMQGQRQQALDSMGEFVKVSDGFAKAIQGLQDKIEGAKATKVEKVRDETGKMIGARVHQADGSVRDVKMQ